MAEPYTCYYCGNETKENDEFSLCSNCAYEKKEEERIEKIRQEQKEQYANARVIEELKKIFDKTWENESTYELLKQRIKQLKEVQQV